MLMQLDQSLGLDLKQQPQQQLPFQQPMQQAAQPPMMMMAPPPPLTASSNVYMPQQQQIPIAPLPQVQYGFPQPIYMQNSGANATMILSQPATNITYNF